MTASRQLIEQRLGLLQVQRVKSLSEPAVHGSKQFASLLRLSPASRPPRSGRGCLIFWPTTTARLHQKKSGTHVPTGLETAPQRAGRHDGFNWASLLTEQSKLVESGTGATSRGTQRQARHHRDLLKRRCETQGIGRLKVNLIRALPCSFCSHTT